MEGDKIGLLDFGIVGYIDDDLREKCSNLFIVLIDRELDGIADSMLELGMVEANVDIDSLKEDIHSSFSRYYETPLKEIQVGHVFHLLMDIMRKYRIKVPPTFVLLFKSLLTVEGFAVELDPEFNLIETLKPFARQLKKKSMQPRYLIEQGKKSLFKFRRLFTKLPDSVNTLLYRIKDVDDGVKNIDTDIRTMAYEVDKSSNRISLGLLITGFIIASALMINIGEPVLYGIPLLSLIGFAIALLLILLLIHSVIKERRLR
jgi:ubiquinone biosynthesis protein